VHTFAFASGNAAWNGVTRFVALIPPPEMVVRLLFLQTAKKTL